METTAGGALARMTDEMFDNTLSKNAFYGCAGLIPDSVTSIKSTAFTGCTGLTKVFTNNLSRYENAFRIKVMIKNGLLIKYNSECEVHECVICYNNFEENDDIFILECFHTCLSQFMY